MTNLQDGLYYRIIELQNKGDTIEAEKQKLMWPSYDNSSYDNFESIQHKDRKIEKLQDELNGIAVEIRNIEELMIMLSNYLT